MSLRRMVSRPKQARRLWLWLSGSLPAMRVLSWNHTLPAADWLLQLRKPSEQLLSHHWVVSRPTFSA